MKIRLYGAFASALLFATIAAAQSPRMRPDFIQSMTEPGEGLTIHSVAPDSRYATFATSPARGILLAVPAGASAEERARAFVRTYGHAFGLDDRSELRTMRAPETDEVGIEHVRMQQVHEGIPVRAGEFLVHMKGPRVLAANGHAVADFPLVMIPKLPADRAVFAAKRVLAKRHISDASATYSEPRLEILNRTLISGIGNDQSRLAWFIEVTGEALDEYIWIDAQSGALLLRFSQLAEALYRTVYNSGHVSGNLPGTLMRTEGQANTGDVDADNAYLFAGVTYNYFKNNHGRDSYDGAGSELRSSVHYCKDPDCPTYPNAFWNNNIKQMVYGDGYASADDVVGHELTHAVTASTAGLLYYVQSGALSESFSDVFGETVDLTDGYGTDTTAVRWLMGEDMNGGAIRNMYYPNNYSQPARMSDSWYFVCSTTGWTDPSQDQGGVHTNSGVPNHAYALMVDGGTFNGKTIAGIGLTKAAKVEYRALTTYLTSGAGFIDAYNALNRSCNDLLGTAGITTSDCLQVKNALDAVEMSLPWGCQGAVQAPAKCPSGTTYLTRVEGFENGVGNWIATAYTLPSGASAGSWIRINDWANSGQYAEYGNDPDGYSDHQLQMLNAVTIPSGGRLYFDHAYEFENDSLGTLYDGGVIEYSANGGPWTDAGALVDAGAPYDGVIYTGAGNPLSGRGAFTGGSYGWTGTRLNLATLAGLNVRFRFRIGTDEFGTSLGWGIDNVAIYRCATATPFTDDPVVPRSTVVKAVHINELRDRINANRIARGLTTFSFTDALAARSTAIKTMHINELRSAISACYAAAGRVTPSYTDPTLATGTTIKAAHINELRSAVLSIESLP